MRTGLMDLHEMKAHRERTVWSFTVGKHTVFVKRRVSGHSFLEPWWMKPGLENMRHHLLWTLAKT